MGLPVFPCAPKKKVPLTEHGFKDATTDIERIQAWWKNCPDANIGMPAGAVSGIVVIDLDNRNDGDRNWEAVISCFESLPHTPYSFTGNGRHLFFAHPGGFIKCTSGEIAAGIDVKGDGGYVIVPPSIHPDGPTYGWELSSDIADIAPSPLPDWLLGLLSRSDDVSEREKTSSEQGPIPEGQRDLILTKLAGHMRRIGMSQASICAGLIQINAERCRPPLSKAQVEKIAHSVARYEPDQMTVALIENWHAQVVAPEQPDESDAKIESPGPFPLELIERSPDIVKQVYDYYSKVAVEMQPVLMLASLIAATGTVLGHKVKDYTGLRTNTYTVGITITGGGKEATREVMSKILRLADLEDMCGPEDFASDSGLIAILEKQNPILFQIDEIGRHLQCVNAGPQKNPYLYNIGSVLLKLYGKANSTYRSKAYADIKKNKVIHNPHVCLFGTSIRNNFWKAMDIDSLEGGFLPRLLLFHDYSETKSGGSREGEPPQKVIEFFNFWGHRRISGGNLEQAGTCTLNPHPMIVPYTQEAEGIMADLKLFQKQQQKKYDSLGVLWSRARENAGKLALIYAAWKNAFEPVIDAEAAQWAVDVITHVVRYGMHEASMCLSDGPFHERCQKVLQALEGTSASRPLTLTAISRKLQRMTPKERNEAIEALREQKRIEVKTDLATTRPVSVYWRV